MVEIYSFEFIREEIIYTIEARIMQFVISSRYLLLPFA